MLPNETVVIVGGSGALGSAVVEALSKRGYGDIVATWRRSEPPAVASGNVQWVRYNSASSEGLSSLSAAVNGRGVGFLLFAAGEPSSKLCIVNTERDEWTRLWQSNVLSFTEVYRALHRDVRKGRGRVLVVSSDTTTKLGARNGPYSASKAALEATASTLAREELAFGVRVNVLAPSLFESPLAERVLQLKGVKNPSDYKRSLPWGRPVLLKEVASAAVSLLCDDKWSYASGQVFRLGVE